MKLLAVCLLAAFAIADAGGIPMVENSVKFALERCKQFLHLAEFLQPDALAKNREIRRTKKVCDHIVLIRDDFVNDSADDEDKEEKIEALAMKKPLKKNGRKSTKKNDFFSNCQVQLFNQQHFLVNICN